MSIEPPSELQRHPGTPGNNDGLECNGNLVLLGDSQSELVCECGAFLREDRSCDHQGCISLWIYQRDTGSFPREVRLFNDIVRGIRALSRLPQ